MNKINVITLCSGYDAMTIALKRLRRDYSDFDFDLLAWSEIDRAACLAHDAIHPEYADRNVGDMTTISWDDWKEQHNNPTINLLIYSTPCQSVSTAGKQAGMKKGDDAASALIWHTEKAIESLKPQYLLLENVRGMVSKRNRADFDEWCALLESYGYANFWQILDSSKYGVPQHRERVFLVSILRTEDNPNPTYNFPAPISLTQCVEDIMVPLSEVPDDAWIDPERVSNKVVRDILDQPNVYEELLWRYHVEEASRRLFGRSDFDFMIEHYDQLKAYATETLGAKCPD